MQIIAEQKNTRQSPRKVRLAANSVRKLTLEKAIEQLSLMEKRSSLVLIKTVRQAIADAWHNHGLKFEDLSLGNILITEGPRYKRFRAVSRGRGHGIIKRSSHIKVILESKKTEDQLKNKDTAKKGSLVKQSAKKEIGNQQNAVSVKNEAVIEEKNKKAVRPVARLEKQPIKQNIIKKTDKTRRKV